MHPILQVAKWHLVTYRAYTNYQSNLLLAFLPSIVEDQEFEQAANAGSDGLDAEYRSADGGALLCSWVRNICICHCGRPTATFAKT